MAKIASQDINIKISKLVKDSDSDSVELLDKDSIESLEAVVHEILSDKSVIVEVE